MAWATRKSESGRPSSIAKLAKTEKQNAESDLKALPDYQKQWDALQHARARVAQIPGAHVQLQQLDALIAANRSRTRTAWAMLGTRNAALGWIAGVTIVVLGVLMAIPALRTIFGFGALDQFRRLREPAGRVLYAHADLSGLSLFEEASWWGDQAARQVLGQN